MLARWRWIPVIAGVAALATVPWLVSQRSASPSAVDATGLLRSVQHSSASAYSGYVESVGALSVPVTDQISEIADLLGARNQLRVWWRNSTDWRVDRLNAFGETDTHRDATGTWTWEYERLRATRTSVPANVAVRLPDSVDVLPPELARRLLSEARPEEVTALPSRIVAGRSVPGLRLRPAQPQSSIDHVDVWAEPASGLALRVEVYGSPTGSPAVSTSFLDFSVSRPSASATAFTPPDQARVRFSNGFDVISAANANSRSRAPAELAGIPRATRTVSYGAVGVYGRGVTELVAVPLRGSFSASLREQLLAAGGIADGDRIALAAGPIHLVLLDPGEGPHWLAVGTVTAATVQAAAADLAAI